MKQSRPHRLMGASLIISLTVVSLFSSAQTKPVVEVHLGSELISVVQLLAGRAEYNRSAYVDVVLNYFGSYKNHPAVEQARELNLMNCDFPLRLSWAFYNFKRIKLHQIETLVGYEDFAEIQKVRAFFEACKAFYIDTHFEEFYQLQKPAYAKWIASFEKNLYQDRLFTEIDSFYKLDPGTVTFTLGGLNCGTYCVPDLGVINPKFRNHTLIMVAFMNIGQSKVDHTLQPDFYNPDFANQLIWHEMGHAYLDNLFDNKKSTIADLKFIFDSDTVMQKLGDKMGWSMFLNENITQAVTSLLRIKTGIIKEEDEMKRLRAGEFYKLSLVIMPLIDQQYYGRNQYANFADYFPLLLNSLKKHFKKS